MRKSRGLFHSLKNDSLCFGERCRREPIDTKEPNDPIPQSQADVDRLACLGGTVLVNLPDCRNEPGEIQLITLICHC